MIRLIVYFFAALLVMGVYVASYFVMLKPGRAANHGHGVRSASYQVPLVKVSWLPSGFWRGFYAPVQYVDAHWVRPGYWGTDAVGKGGRALGR